MDWNLMGMLHSMSATAKGVVAMLLLMSAISIGLAVERGLRYAVARNQTRSFAQQVTSVLEEGKLDEAISIAVRNKKSPVASIVATGLAEFRSAPPHASNTELIDAAERGLDRSVATIHAELKRGLSGLATIGSTAPFVGLFGTVVGIIMTYGTQWLMMHAVPASLTQETVYKWWPIAGAISVVGALLGAIFPGWKAVKQDVIQALSYE